MLFRDVRLEAKFLIASKRGGVRPLGTEREAIFPTTLNTIS